MPIKITTVIKGYTVEVTGADASSVRLDLKEVQRFLESTPNVQSEEKPSATKGTADQMLGWLRANGAHSKTYIAKHSGFSNCAYLLRVLAKSGQLEWHETVYKRTIGNGGWRTMRAAYVDGSKPDPVTRGVARSRIREFVEKEPGHIVTSVQKRCKVPETQALELITDLLKAGQLELNPVQGGRFGVFLAGTSEQAKTGEGTGNA